ncbi:MAG: transcriptional repressor LexA [Holophagales bacterium]|nr:transcriptional repressor LexA [Holophagales bacterium]
MSKTRTPRGSYLTERQKAILEFIADYQQRHGISPTHREIREEFGYSSFGTVYKHLKLLQKKGYLHRDWNQKRGLELLRAVPGSQLTTEQEVPFLGQIAAGQPIEAVSSPESMSVPNHLFGGSASDHYVLRVAGESMIEEGIHDGDLVVVLRREEARPGEMVVALIDGDAATLKRFFPEGDRVRLQPANPNMEAIRVPASAVKVQGVVVGLMRKF